jgi:hypothetical protein
MIKIKVPLSSEEKLLMIYGVDGRSYVAAKSDDNGSIHVYSIEEVEFPTDCNLSDYTLYKDVAGNIRVRISRFSDKELTEFIYDAENHRDEIAMI